MATSGPKSVPKAAQKNSQSVSAEDMEGRAPEAKKSKKKTIVILSLAMLLLGGAAAGAWYFMGHNKDVPAGPNAPSQAKSDPGKPPVFVALEPFTVNLQTETTEQFLQVSFTIQVADQNQVDLIKLYMPQVRSRLLLLLSSKKASEISTVEGKKKLSNEIIEQVKQPFTAGAVPPSVSNVFFTSFVIQ